jgi:hypothetical protein
VNLDLGVRNRATARAYRREQAQRRRGAGVSPQFATVERRHRPDVEDRWGRRKGLVHPDGRPYSPCPMCEQRSMVVVKRLPGGNAHWRCEACTYEDTDEGPLV